MKIEYCKYGLPTSEEMHRQKKIIKWFYRYHKTIRQCIYGCNVVIPKAKTALRTFPVRDEK